MITTVRAELRAHLPWWLMPTLKAIGWTAGALLALRIWRPTEVEADRIIRSMGEWVGRRVRVKVS